MDQWSWIFCRRLSFCPFIRFRILEQPLFEHWTINNKSGKSGPIACFLFWLNSLSLFLIEKAGCSYSKKLHWISYISFKSIRSTSSPSESNILIKLLISFFYSPNSFSVIWSILEVLYFIPRDSNLFIQIKLSSGQRIILLSLRRPILMTFVLSILTLSPETFKIRYTFHTFFEWFFIRLYIQGSVISILWNLELVAKQCYALDSIVDPCWFS